jgi:hypothetical protein
MHRETVFENGLRVPAELHELLAEILSPYAIAEETGDRGSVAPFLTRREFDSVMLSIDEVYDALNAVSADHDDHDRILSLVWDSLPNWAKSREAFEAKWRVRIADPAHSISYGYVRGNVDQAIDRLVEEPGPALAVGMS